MNNLESGEKVGYRKLQQAAVPLEIKHLENMAENEISVPLEQFFMGKWIQDNEIPSISATEIHSFKPLRRSKRTNTITRNATKLHCTSHVLSVPTHTKEQRKKREKQIVGDKVNSNPQKKDNGCLNITSQEIQRESSLSSKNMCHSVTKEADKENHTLTISNVRVTSSITSRVTLAELPVNIVGKVMNECEDKVRSRSKASNETKNKKEESKKTSSNNNNKNEKSKKTNRNNNNKEECKTTNNKNNNRKESKNTNSINHNKEESKNTNSKNQQQDTNTNYDKTTRPLSITENDMEKGMSMKTLRKTSVEKENQVEKATGEGKQKNAKDTRKRKKRKASVFLYDFDDDYFDDDYFDDDDDISWTDSRVKKKAKLKVTKEKITNLEPREGKKKEKEKPVGKATIINNGQTKEQTKAAQIKHKRGANKTETQQNKSNTKKSKAQQTNKNSRTTKTQKHTEQKKKLEAHQNKKSSNKPKTSDGNKKIISHHEDPKSEACAVTAKHGTLKYLKQREKYVEATAKEAHVDQDFFLDKIGLTPKKSKVSQLLMPGSMDDSLTITTPKSSTSDREALDTPRIHLMGMLGGYTPISDKTPATPASETKRDALVVVYRHLHANKGKPRGIRKSLQMSRSSTVIPEQPHKKLTPLEINALLEHQEGCNYDSSVDEYFEDTTDVPSPAW
ncbi:hypothetical protein Pcinc_028542 [Petrolisthes cinctipes]|uniref:Uncharacterized protein n=1 Tax=Petrolisthes cinctipes TaxID=88211 RepID=A0AAE1F2N1_PETCI|nr:hypothetical protein Pcinc_028542 [Petrolisthes cinctipes]